jgi:protein CpxP
MKPALDCNTATYKQYELASDQLKKQIEKMKKLFLTLAIAAIGFTASYAQDNHKERLTPAQRAEKSTAKLEKELGLTKDQKQKVYAIELDKASKAEAWHKQNHDARKAMKEEHEAVKKSTDAKLDQVLTAEQKQKLSVLKAEKKEKQKDRHHKTKKA